MAYITVSAADLAKNYEILKKELKDTRILAFFKADGYGFGLEWMAEILYEAGQRTFCTARAEDAFALRGRFADAEIWLCSVYDDEKILRGLTGAGVVPTVDSADGLERLCRVYGETEAEFHLSVDTGMGRNGLSPEEVPAFAAAFKRQNARMVSCFTHYANCYGGARGEKATMEQNARFLTVVGALKVAGVETGICHAANSAAALLYPGLRMDAVRIGSALTGRCIGAEKAGLIRLGELKAPVVSLRTLRKGDTLGYGSVYRARREKKIAIVEAGHCDGVFAVRAQDGFRFSDRLSAAKRAFFAKPLTAGLNGKKLRVIGRVGLTDLAVEVKKTAVSPGDLLTFDFNPVICGGRKVLHE